MRALADVAEVSGHPLPLRSMTGAGPGKGVRHFVQQHLVDLIVFEPGGEVLRHGDALARVVAQASTGLGIVEAERPLGRVEMQGDEGFRPSPHSHQLSHEMTLTASTDRVSGIRSMGSNSTEPRRGRSSHAVRNDSAMAIATIELSTSSGEAPMRTRMVTAVRKSSRADFSSSWSKYTPPRACNAAASAAAQSCARASLTQEVSSTRAWSSFPRWCCTWARRMRAMHNSSRSPENRA